MEWLALANEMMRRSLGGLSRGGCVSACVLGVCEGLEELAGLQTVPSDSGERGREVAGSWGTLPPFSTSLGNPYGRGLLNTGIEGPLKSLSATPISAVATSSLLSPQTTTAHPPPPRTNVRLGAWEGLQVHGQTSY